ncbi:nucleotidyltransferase family protein [Candidatus Woesearchaeota archaeon]|nr:nucleotidyltransferase family protein [Candidatus Woesearchaeota archaeon]
MTSSQKIPPEIMRILRLFHQNHLSSNLFKCEHILAGSNKNLDILFEHGCDYLGASRLLEKEGYVLYLPESIEKYKRMYTLFKAGIVTRIHLHREIAWHGLRILDKKPVFSRAKMLAPSIFVPSPEDQLLIHVAHVTFENMEISDSTARLIGNLAHNKLDWHYIHDILQNGRWRSAFDHVLSSVHSNKQPSKKKLMLTFVKKAAMMPSSWMPLARKSFSIFFRKMSLRRKGCLIALVGVNGSGKTTLAEKLLPAYSSLSRTVNGQFSYYFGWVPFSPLSKVVSQQFKKKGKSAFKELNEEHTRKKAWSVLREAFFLFNYFEYVLRYLFAVRPRLTRNTLVITDRYFYDLYGQYRSAVQSRVLPLLLRLYPKPDYLFVLDADLLSLRHRAKFGGPRTVKETADLEGQRRRYLFIGRKFHGIILDTTHPITENIQDIISRSWRWLVLSEK